MDFAALELRFIQPQTTDLYTRLAQKYNVPRALVKRVLHACMYGNKQLAEDELEKVFQQTYRMFT